MSSQQDTLNYLAELTGNSTPAFFNALSEKELTELESYVKSVIDRGEAGLDRLFESMSMMMKFIPNFILHAITPKYIEPSIAARITSKLTVKQALGVTTGLPIEYIGDTSAYLESQLAAEILSGIKKNRVEQILAYLVNKHPLKTLDILEHVSKDFIKFAQPLIPVSLSEHTDLSPARREIFDKILQL